jgi:hypothetical protein
MNVNFIVEIITIVGKSINLRFTYYLIYISVHKLVYHEGEIR